MHLVASPARAVTVFQGSKAADSPAAKAYRSAPSCRMLLLPAGPQGALEDYSYGRLQDLHGLTMQSQNGSTARFKKAKVASKLARAETAEAATQGPYS